MNQANINVVQNGEVVLPYLANVEADAEGWHENYMGGVLSALYLFD